MLVWKPLVCTLAACIVNCIGPPWSNFWGPSSGNIVAPPKAPGTPVYSPTFYRSMVLSSSLWGPYFHLSRENMSYKSQAIPSINSQAINGKYSLTTCFWKTKGWGTERVGSVWPASDWPIMTVSVYGVLSISSIFYWCNRTQTSMRGNKRAAVNTHSKVTVL